MLYNRFELYEKYASTYQLNKALDKKILFKVIQGVYSDEELVEPIAVITKKYPDFIFTMDSAFYYWGLTDVIPDQYFIATKKTSIRLKQNDIKQCFVDKEIFELGKTSLLVDDVNINIYDKERMLIELVRKKNQMPFDYYKEIISNFRKITSTLDTSKLAEYISYFSNQKTIYNRIMSEVF